MEPAIAEYALRFLRVIQIFADAAYAADANDALISNDTWTGKP